MTDDLLPYDESELLFIRKLAEEFAAHPQAAARLKLEPTRSADRMPSARSATRTTAARRPQSRRTARTRRR